MIVLVYLKIGHGFVKFVMAVFVFMEGYPFHVSASIELCVSYVISCFRILSLFVQLDGVNKKG